MFNEEYSVVGVSLKRVKGLKSACLKMFLREGDFSAPESTSSVSYSASFTLREGSYLVVV
jgi:hypothetical protein